MKRFVTLLLLLGIVASAFFVGCDNDSGGEPVIHISADTKNKNPSADTVTDVWHSADGIAGSSSVATTSATTELATSATTLATTVPEPEPIIYEIELINNGTSEYSFVCANNDVAARYAANEFSKRIKNDFGIDIPLNTVNGPTGLIDGDKNIMIGKLCNELEGKLSGYNDFALEIKENKLMLAATNGVAYNYLFEYLYYEFFADIKDGRLVMSSEDCMVYSASDISDISYPEYHRMNAGTCESDFMLKCFEGATFIGKNGLSMTYRLYIPFDYTPEREYPVVLFLHGAGHRGTDNAAPVKGIIYNAFNHKDPLIDGAIVLVPQCPSGFQWVDTPWAKGSYSVDAVPESKAMKTALELLDKVESEFSTDKDRCYAFGLSMGGFGTWDVIMRHPDRFAAAIALCGGADPSKGAVLADMPIWTVHSLDDESVPVKGTQDMVNAIKNAGGDKIIYDELNGYGHGVGTLTAKRDEVFTWLFAQTK